MTQGVQTRLEGTTLVVRIPMRFQRRGGRKRIVSPDETELARTSSRNRTERWSGAGASVAMAADA
jgi:hypothetical protein